MTQWSHKEGLPVTAPDLIWLRSLPLYGGLADDDIDTFTRTAQHRSIAPSEYIYREGDHAEDLFLVEDGELEVLKGERCVQLTTLVRGDYFGEMSFIDMQPRSATVRATRPGVLWRWPYVQLHALYRSQPKAYTLLVMNIARQLSRRLRRADEALCRLP